MSRRRFYAPPSAFDLNFENLSLASDEARHLRDVLRLQPGDDVYVFDGAGREFHCRLERSERHAAQLKVVEQVEPARPESPLKLTLAVALLKGEKFDLVVQKATELGVVRIVPLLTQHADIRLRDASDAEKRVGRWQRIGLEAAKQSGRALVPEVTMPVKFPAIIDRTVELDSSEGAVPGLMFSERDGDSLSKAKGRFLANVTSLTALVGSEGGWADEEINAARDAGWQIVTLGGRILRAETAAITVAALLQHSFGDLS